MGSTRSRDFAKAEEYFQLSVKHLENAPDIVYRSVALEGLAMVYSETERLPEAINISEQAIKVNQQACDSDSENIRLYDNLLNRKMHHAVFLNEVRGWKRRSTAIGKSLKCKES